MKPRRTTVNRRKAGRAPLHHHLLELNVRTASVKRQRRQRTGGLLWKIAAAIVLLAILGAGGRLVAEKFFFHNEEYSLRHLEADLGGVISREELIDLTGFREGINIFRLDLDQANRTLSALPEVRSATVERVLPDTVKISLERRVPVFLFAGHGETGESFQPGKSYLCDQEGVMLQPARLDPEFLNLPLLCGVDLTGAVPGKKLDTERITDALNLQKALSGIPEETFRIRSMDVSKPYAVVVTDSSNARFTFGHHDLPAQLDRLRLLLRHCQERGRRIETANLMVSRNTPVTFALTPERGAARITPSPTVKKNAQR